eukprot:1148702-Pelagomonas_calceolata.AAC.5
MVATYSRIAAHALLSKEPACSHTFNLQMRDGGNLLTRAGFALPAVDCDTFVLKYPVDPPSSQQQPHQQQAEQSQKQQQQQQQQQNYSSGARLDECSMQTCEGDGVDSPLGPEAVVAHLRLLGESNAVIHRQQKLQPDAALAVSAMEVLLSVHAMDAI